MFSKLVSRNSKRDRKNNSLYFSSMVLSIISFYIILSLSHQDVMIFLKQIESDAVNKLFSMIPILYVATLFILFFHLTNQTTKEFDNGVPDGSEEANCSYCSYSRI